MNPRSDANDNAPQRLERHPPIRPRRPSWLGAMALGACGWIGFAADTGIDAGPHAREVIKLYRTEVSPEEPAARQSRHRRVTSRRLGPVVMAHRGATAFGVENSLGACVAALDYGADGCAVDLRRTRDGVLILFHDDTLDRLTDGFGRVDQASYRELLRLQVREQRRPSEGWPPLTFAALLDVARPLSMLLHLDLKEPGLEAEVARLIEAADAWDHIVFVNTPNAASLGADPRLRPLRYKAPGLDADRRDLDPASVRSALEQPGEMILVGDPRVAAQALHRPARRPQAYTVTFRVARVAALNSEVLEGEPFRPLEFVRHLAASGAGSSTPSLVAMALRAGDKSESETPRSAESERLARDIVARAWAAQQLGRLGRRSPEAVSALETIARNPTRHSERAYDELDGAEAMLALGQLRNVGSVPLLIETLQRAGADRRDGSARLAEAAMATLGALPCRAARRFLSDYIALPEEQVVAYGPAQYEAAARALLRQRSSWSKTASVLRSTNLTVRGAALLECLDHYTEERGLAVRGALPWAAGLPRARP